MRRPWLLGLLATTLAALPATWILWLPGYLASNDGIFHLTRLIDHERMLRAGVWYPRWLPDFGLGHGYPIFDFYPPLSTYVAEALHALGLEVTRAIQAEMALAIVLAGAGMYLWATRLYRSPLAGLMAGTYYVYFPFHLTDVYVRGDLAEVVAYAGMPLTLWAFTPRSNDDLPTLRGGGMGKLLTCNWRPSTRVLLPSLCLAALVLAHNITALAFMPVLLLYLFFQARARPSHLPSPISLVSVALGLALSAFYWAPALLDAPYAHITDFTDPTSTPTRHIWPVAHLVQLRWVFDYDVDRYRVGLTAGLLGLLGPALCVAWRARGRGRARSDDTRPAESAIAAAPLQTAGLFVVVAAVCLFMMSNPSAFIWEHVPLLRFLQFGWRVLFIMALALGCAAGLLALPNSAFPRRISWPSYLLLPIARLFLVGLATLVLAFSGLRDLPRPRFAIPPDQLTPGVLARYEYGNAANGKGADAEFLPSATDPAYVRLGAGLHPRPRVEERPLPNEVRLADAGLTSLEVRTRATAPSRLRFHAFSFPGWQATIDGVAVPLLRESDAGLLAVDVPAGVHSLALRFASTPSRLAALGLSVAALALLLALALRPLLPSTRRLAPALAAGALLLGGCAPPAEGGAWRQARHDFGGLELLAARYDPRPAPGGPLRVELLWLNREANDQPRQVELRLAEPGGAAVTRLREPPYHGVSPTWSWAPGELVRDEHELRLPPGAARALELTVSVTGGPPEPLPLGTVAVPAVPPEPPLTPLNVDFGGKVRLLGYHFARLPAWPPLSGTAPPAGRADTALRPGDWLNVRLRWQALAPIDENYTTFVHLIDHHGRAWAEQDNQPDGTLRPTSSWLPGETVEDDFLLNVPRGALPGVYQLEVGMYRFPEMRYMAHGQGHSLVFGTVKLPLPSARPVAAPLADFAGLRLANAHVQRSPGQLQVDLTWQATIAPDQRYTVFVQLLDAQGKLAAQDDAEPRGGSYPTSVWAPGEVIPDRHVVRLPPALPPGPYRLIAGLYRPDTNQRLTTDAGQDYALLREIQVPAA